MPAPKKQIKKESASSSKSVTKQSSPKGEDSCPVSKAEQLSINQLIAQTLVRYKNEQIQDKKSKFKEISHLATMCEEYLSSFALIGYSIEGEKVVVFNHPTPKDEAALSELLRSIFIGLINNQ